MYTTAPSTAHRIQLGEFDLQFELQPEANIIAHMHQTHERLLSYFQYCHKKKQGTIWNPPVTTTAYFFSRKKPPNPLAKPQRHTKNWDHQSTQLNTFTKSLCCAYMGVVAKFAVYPSQ